MTCSWIGEVCVRSRSSPESGQEEGVLRVTRRMVGREVEAAEVVEVVLDLGALGDGEAHGDEDVDEVVLRLPQGVQVAAGAAPSGQGDVEALLRDRTLESGVGEGVALRIDRAPPRRRARCWRAHPSRAAPPPGAGRARAGSRSASPCGRDSARGWLPGPPCSRPRRSPLRRPPGAVPAPPATTPSPARCCSWPGPPAPRTPARRRAPGRRGSCDRPPRPRPSGRRPGGCTRARAGAPPR